MEPILNDMTEGVFSKNDIEQLKILDAFLPPRIFDAHMHISAYPFYMKTKMDFEEYYADAAVYFGNRRVVCNGISTPTDNLKTEAGLRAENELIYTELDKYPENIGEIMVFPEDTAEDIEKRLTHPRIRGLKCYHIFAKREETFDSYIGEYLPEAAWQVSAKRKMPITLHMVREASLADEGNLRYIVEMAKKYPDAVLILAHAARSFAAWTVFDNIGRLSGLDNVWYDFAGICESPAAAYIVKKLGIERCMWGSDWPVSMAAGKAVSIGDTFYWINERDLRNFKSKTPVRSVLVGTENLLAMRQVAMLCDLNEDAVEALFYNNAACLFGV